MGRSCSQGSLCPLLGGIQTPVSFGLPAPDVGLGIPGSSSTSSAFPAAVSLETGSRKGHHFPLGKVGGQAVQKFLPRRGMDGRLWLLCCPAPGVSGRIFPSQGSSRLWRGTSHSHIPQCSTSPSGDQGQCLESRHEGLTDTAGKAKDFWRANRAGGRRSRWWIGRRRADGNKGKI